MAADNQAPYAEFGRKLSGLRSEAGLSRRALGEQCGVAPSTISNYENGTRIPYADTAVKMARVFGLTVEELLGMENAELAMAREESLDVMRGIHGKKGADRMQAVFQEAAHLAGGDLTDDQLMEFSMEMQKMALLAQQRLNERYTAKRWKDTAEKKAVRTAKAVQAIDQAIRSMTDTHGDSLT